MRYVAYVDTLGFRNKITRMSHYEAVEFIKLFNRTVYELWREMQFPADKSIRGRTFSDSVIVHSHSDTDQELDNMLKFLIRLYRRAITACDLPLRGGIACGQYDDIHATEFENLEKGLIVGTAFIDAYLLESSYNIKGSKLLVGQEINLKIGKRLKDYQTQTVQKNNDGRVIYEVKWGDLLFLTEQNYHALNSFVDLATRSKWIDHYYGTLETFLIKETSENKHEIYTRILEKLKKEYKYTDVDNFIENYLKSESAVHTKKSFLGFLRDRL